VGGASENFSVPDEQMGIKALADDFRLVQVVMGFAPELLALFTAGKGLAASFMRQS